MNDMRQYIDATNHLNESLDEGPVGWAANKLAKAGQRVASKVTYGATKQKLKQNVNVRSGAEQLIKIWNTGFGGRGMQRTPANIVRFLAKDKDLKMSRDDIKAAWNKTPQLTKNFGTFDDVANQLKRQKQPPQPGERRDQTQSTESFSEAVMSATEPMSIDNLRNLLINAIHVKNASEAEKELGGFPGDDEEQKAQGAAAPEQQPMPAGDAGKPEPTTKDLKQAGAVDMDGDKDYDYDDIAATAMAQGKGEEALKAFIKKMATKSGTTDKANLAYGIITGKSPNIGG